MATLTLKLGEYFSITGRELAKLNGQNVSSDRVFTASKVPGLYAPYLGTTLSGTPDTVGRYVQDYGQDRLGYQKYGEVTIEVVGNGTPPPDPEPDPEPPAIPVVEGVSLTVGATFNRTADEVAASIGLTNDEGAMYEFDTVVSTPPPGTNLEWNKISGTVTTPGEYNLRVFYAVLGVKYQQTNYKVRVTPKPVDPTPTDPEPVPDTNPVFDPAKKTISLLLGVPVSIKASEVAALNGEDVTKGTKRVFGKAGVPGMTAGYLSTYLSGTPNTEGLFSQEYGRDELGYTRSGAVNVVVRAKTPPTVPTDPTVPADPGGREYPHPDSERLLTILGYEQTSQRLAMADEHLATVTVFVYGYTRGRGFELGGFPSDPTPVPMWDLKRVILSAAARSLANPQSLKQYAAGDYSETPSVLTSWTLPEIAVLHRYRRRTR